MIPGLILALIGAFIVACVVGWIVGEVRDLRAPRIASAILLIALAAAFAYGAGWFLGSANAYIDASVATDEFFDAAVARLDTGDPAAVEAELRRLRESVTSDYRGENFTTALKDASQRLVVP